MSRNQFDDNVPFWRNEGKLLLATILLVLLLLVLPW